MSLLGFVVDILHNLTTMIARPRPGRLQGDNPADIIEEQPLSRVAEDDSSGLHAVRILPASEVPQQRVLYSQAAGRPPTSSRREHKQELNVTPKLTRGADLESVWRKAEKEATLARQEYQREIESQRADLKDTREKAKALAARVAEMEAEAKKASAHISVLDRTILVLRNEKRDTFALLETKSTELREAQAFLTQVDGVSDIEVVQVVQRLNSTIYQTCTSVARAFEAQYGEVEKRGTFDRALQSLSTTGLLSAEMLDALCCFQHKEDSVLVQMALQGVMVAYTRWLCNTWDFRIEGGSTFENVYDQIRATEPPSVAGRWRALARKHVKNLLSPDEERCELARNILAEHVSAVLLLCGVPQAFDKPLHDDLLLRFGVAFRDIILLALEFQRIVGEQIVSHDLRVFAADAGEPFDSARMDDEWNNPKKHASPSGQVAGCVLNATQLGLYAVTGARESEVVVALLKSNAVLRTALQELWAEQAQGAGLAEKETVNPENGIVHQDRQPERMDVNVSHKTLGRDDMSPVNPAQHGTIDKSQARAEIGDEKRWRV